MTSVAFPLSTDGITSSQKGHLVGQAGLGLGATMLVVSNNHSVTVQ